MIGLIHACTLQKRNRKKKLTYTSGSGTPVVGQTVTGGASGKTAVIDKVSTGYIVVKTVSGAFTIGETLTVGTNPPGFTFSGTLSAQADYQNQSGEYEYYWTNDQTSVPCRLYYSGSAYSGSAKGEIIHETGQLLDQPLKCALPSTVTVSSLEYRIVNTVTGFSGTYDIQALYTLSGISGIDHYEAVCKVVP